MSFILFTLKHSIHIKLNILKLFYHDNYIYLVTLTYFICCYRTINHLKQMEAQWKAEREAQRLEQEQKDKKEDETKKKDNGNGGGNGKVKQGGYISYLTTYI